LRRTVNWLSVGSFELTDRHYLSHTAYECGSVKASVRLHIVRTALLHSSKSSHDVCRRSANNLLAFNPPMSQLLAITERNDL
jgi:hypothetical protein